MAGRHLQGCKISLVLVAAVSCGPGCSTVVIPPAQVIHPIPVHLADYGRHSTIIFPRADGSYTEYSFGEWRRYALGEDGPGRVLPTLLIPTRGTLGRADYASLDELGQAGEVEELRTIQVESGALERLAAGLDRQFAAAAAERVYNPESRSWYVPTEERYWLFHDCNDVLARWLRQVGCRVPRVSRVARFRIGTDSDRKTRAMHQTD